MIDKDDFMGGLLFTLVLGIVLVFAIFIGKYGKDTAKEEYDRTNVAANTWAQNHNGNLAGCFEHDIDTAGRFANYKLFCRINMPDKQTIMLRFEKGDTTPYEIVHE